MINIRWLAPEVIEEQRFTPKSDVYSFAVCLWELYSLGKVPYAKMNDKADIIEAILNQEYLEKPSRCHPKLYDIMLTCWRLSPKDRPSFYKLETEITVMQEENVNHVMAKDHYVAVLFDDKGKDIDNKNGQEPVPLEPSNSDENI